MLRGGGFDLILLDIEMPEVAGYTGTSRRAGYTCIGDTVVAFRLEGHTNAIGCWLAVDGATHAAIGDRIPLQSFGEIALKGKTAATQVFGISRGL